LPPVEPLISIGLPVRNGERYVGDAVRSVLDQEHGHLELVISDNASDDGTEEICRQFARSDGRVRYHRQPQNIGLVPNFNAVLHMARGTYFKWMGDDDWLMPSYLTRCVEVLDDNELILVTTQQAHVDSDGAVEAASYDATRMRSARPVERFAEMLRLLNESRLLLDPLYGMMRQAPVARLARPVMLFEDEIFAARLALAGRFGHVDQVLSYRRSKRFPRLSVTARRLGVPPWQANVATTLQCRELLAAVREVDLSPRERRQASAAVARMFLRRKRATATHRSRKLAGLVSHAVARPPGLASTSPKGR
jgi:glycosyltransferase involved in cell wall biosynthesis